MRKAVGQLFYAFRVLEDGKKVMHLNLGSFKTAPCETKTPHNIKMCQFYHSEVDRRRTGITYSADLCPEQKKKKCLKGDLCEMAHSNVERLYHVEKYKTKFCVTTKVQDCTYA